MADDEWRLTGDVDYASVLCDYVEGMGDLDDEAAEYAELGSLRTVEPLDADQREHATRVINELDLQRKQCYWNCQLVAPEFDEYTYAEGYVMSDIVPVPVQHAWVEREGKVVELTLEGRPEPHPSSKYFGVAYDDGSVSEQVSSLGEARPLAGKTKSL